MRFFLVKHPPVGDRFEGPFDLTRLPSRGRQLAVIGRRLIISWGGKPPKEHQKQNQMLAFHHATILLST